MYTKSLRKSLFKLIIALALTVIPTTAFAEGIVYYGGYGLDGQSCGAGIRPCRTYDYARGQACRYSENEQDAYHVYHVYNGYVSTCDMTALGGREPGAFERNWIGFFQSIILPTIIVALLVFAWRYIRTYRRIAQAS